MLVCVPLTVDGSIDPRWGRADRLTTAHVTSRRVTVWQEFDVGWDALHDAAGEGAHHARVARFLLDHHVEAVVANHIGPGMLRMLEQMEIPIHLGAAGDARDAVVAAIGDAPS
jgi:predicted Fe-Mo cluster-binding NifX family protein